MGRNVTTVGQEKKEGKRELKKHAATIHCSNTLTLLQRKITNALLYHAYNELMQKDEHEITVKQLCRLIGYQGNNHAAIKEALKALISTVIEWNVINDETGAENWTASSIIASVSLEGPMCYYAYSPRMKQLLHSPSMFGKIDLVIQSKFRSSYGLAVYENCIRYRGLPHTKWFDMETFKKLMGVPAGKYGIFRDFKRRVLDKAIDEVNMYSDLLIEAEYIKEGRKVAKVRFKLKERAKRTRLGNNIVALPKLEEIPDALYLTLTERFGLSKDQVELLLSSYERAFIQEKITVVEETKPFQEGKIQNVAAYLVSAVKNDYQPIKATLAQVVPLPKPKAVTDIQALKRKIEKIRTEYQAHREVLINDAIAALKPKKRAAFMQQFNYFAEPVVSTILQLQRRKYKRENVMESPQMKALLRQFALRELDGLNLPSLEEFVSILDDAKRDAWQKLKSHDPLHELLKFND